MVMKRVRREMSGRYCTVLYCTVLSTECIVRAGTQTTAKAEMEIEISGDKQLEQLSSVLSSHDS